jgi:hypothetical protein
VPLKSLVSANKRQLKVGDPEWLTLSTLRSFTITTLFGRSGFEKTSGAVSEKDLPKGVSKEDAGKAVAHVATLLFQRFAEEFNARTTTVIAVAAVLAALGAVAHRSMPWSDEPRRSPEELNTLLTDIVWDRNPDIWDGIAGKATPSGGLSVAGGIKDNGSKTATALEDPATATFHRIRGKRATELQARLPIGQQPERGEARPASQSQEDPDQSRTKADRRVTGSRVRAGLDPRGESLRSGL